MLKRWVIYFLLFLCGTLYSFSQQQLTFEHITTSQGLSQNSINCIFQDRSGYLWFGTTEGLNRYDGISFTSFKSRSTDTNSLSDNWITTIREDTHGYLWIGTSSGLNKFDPLTGRIKRYLTQTNNKNDNFVQSIYIDNDSLVTKGGEQQVLWIGTWVSGLIKLVINAGHEEYTRYSNSKNNNLSLAGNGVSYVYRDPQRRLWIGTNGNSLDQFISSKNSFIHNYVDTNHNAQCEIRTFFTDSKGRMWAAVYNRGIYQVIPEIMKNENEEQRLTFIPIDTGLSSTTNTVPLPTSFAEDLYGNIWVGYLRNGIKKFEQNLDGTYTITQYESHPSEPSSLHENDFRSLYIDKSNILWAGGAFYGINKAQLIKQISLYQHNPNDSNSLPIKSIRGVYEIDENKLLIGGYGELALFDRKRNTVTPLNPKIPHSSSYQGAINNVFSIAPDPDFPDSILWFGTECCGLIRYTLKNNRYEKFVINPEDSTTLNSNDVFALNSEEKGYLWVGTWFGIQKLAVNNAHAPSFVSFRHNPNNPKSLSTGIVYSIKKSSDGILWVASNDGGVNAMLPSQPNEFVHYIHDPADSSSLSCNDVRSICEDRQGRMWFGTLGGGLNLLLPDRKSFKHFMEPDGLPSDVIYGILEDSSGNLWLSTNKGISRFTPETNKFWNISVSDGLQDYEFNSGSYYQCKHGELFFGGINGLNSFFPERIARNTYIPPVQITSVSVFGKAIPMERLHSSDILSFADDEDVLSFEFIALDYLSPEKNQYQYKLLGNDEGWINAGSRRYVSYAHLAPGSYIFQVKGSNSDGVWNEQASSISFVINPPFWGTWWFRSLGILLFLALGPMIHYRKVRALEQEQRLRHEFLQQLIVSQESERKRIATDMHDSVGQNLLVVKNQASMASKAFLSLPEVKEQFEQIAIVTDETLKEVRQIARNLRPYQLDQIGLTDTIRSMVRKVGEAASIAFCVELDAIDGLLSKDSDIHVYRIVQEAVNNILKHSKAKNAFIVIKKEETLIRLIIRDDGIGFDISRTEGGTDAKTIFGLKGIEERVEILNGRITMTSIAGSETKTEIEIPIQNE